MARFESVGNTTVNIDKIRTYYKIAAEPDTLIVELDNGETYRARDKFGYLEDCLEGNNFVVQVIPCSKPLYAWYKDDEGEHSRPVHYLGLCANGCVRPLDVRDSENIGFADEACNYTGLHEKALRRPQD